MTSPKDTLLDAIQLVTDLRAEQHGDFQALHSLIARLWSAYLDTKITARDAAWMLCLVKVARDRMRPGSNPDNAVDAAGYAAIAGSIEVP